MPEPIRLTVMKKLCSEIEQRADLSGSVFRGRSYFGPSMGVPSKMVSVFEDGAHAEDYPQQTGDGRANVVRLPLILMGYDVEGIEHPTDPAMIMMHDVLAALRGVKRDGAPDGNRSRNYLGMGRIVDDIQIGNGHVYPAFANENTSVAFFLVPVTVTYVDLAA